MTSRIEGGAESLVAYLGDRRQLVSTWRARVIDKTSDERMVVEYSLRCRGDACADAPRRFIGKFYSDDTGLAAFRGMQAIHAQLQRLPEPPPLAIPQAFYYDATIRCLVQQRVPGTPYPTLVRKTDSHVCLKSAGCALALLHSLEPISERVATLKDHVAELINPHPVELAKQFPEYRPLIERCCDRLLNEREWTNQCAPTPIHRDYHLRQLFYARPRVWLVDWDLFATGDPAFDVAYFATYLRNHLSESACEPAIRAFLEGYLTSGSEEVLERLALYESFNYLRRACRRFRLKDDGWEAQMRAMLQKINSR